MAEICLHEEEYYQRAYGAWLGKNIGGTLGEPVEGRKEQLDLDFYPELPAEFDTTGIDHYPDETDEGEPTPLANDDLDLQLIWLHALEQYGAELTARELGQEWVDHVFFPYNEYRYALANLRRNIDPPICGQFNNEFYNDCMGAPIRSEIWALIAPGVPNLAAAYAYEDAIVDHAGGEGVYGELFNAALESAAFAEDDPHRLIEIGLSYIPENCGIASAVRAAVAQHREGYDWEAAREFVLEEYGHPDMTNAPQNFAFVVLGWLYGEGFGDSLLKCVNCGYDTDSSGATIGSILGILYGKDGIPEEWVEPIGHRVVTRPQVKGFPVPNDLAELTERTLSMAREVIAVHDLPVRIDPSSPTNVPAGAVETFTDRERSADIRRLWDRSPTTVTYPVPTGSRSDPTLVVSIDVGEDGPAIGREKRKELRIGIKNGSTETWRGTLDLALPEGWAGPDPREYELAPNEELTWNVSVRSDTTVEPYYEPTLRIERTHNGSPWATETVDFGLVPATHWRVEDPTDTEWEGSFPGNRLPITEVVDGDEPGTYIARSTLVNPHDRTMQLEVRTSAAVTVSLDGSVVIERPSQAKPDMLATDLDHHSDDPGIDVPAGKYELVLELERSGDEPLTAYVIPAATGDTDSPGGYYFLTDVLFV